MSRRRQPFRIDLAPGAGVEVVTMSGVIDEAADLTPLAALGQRPGQGPIEVDLHAVERINSAGVRAWIDAVRALPPTVPVTFVRCPPAIVDQCNMVTGFLGHGRLASFFAPMVCRECDEQVDTLYTVAAVHAAHGALPPSPCPRCKRPMAIDDLEDQYLLFIRDGA